MKGSNSTVWSRALFRSKVDDFVPHTQLVNFGKAREQTRVTFVGAQAGRMRAPLEARKMRIIKPLLS